MAFGEGFNRKNRAPLLAGLVAALSIGGEAAAQQAPRGRPISQAEFEQSYLSPEEVARRRGYEERTRTDPGARDREARYARLQTEGAAYCNKISDRIRKEGYAKVEKDIGGQGMMDCDLLQ